MPARLVTAPSVEPVTLAQAKKHLRLETALDDDDVLTLVTAARQYLEQICWRGFMLQTWEITLAGFRGKDRLDLTPEWQPPAAYQTPLAPTSWLAGARGYRFQPFLELDRGHLADTPNVSVQYYDANNALQTLDPSVYFTTGQQDDTRYGRLWLNEVGGKSWPNTAARPDAVKVTATYGWATVAKVPEPLKHAIKLLISQMYEHRTPQVTGTIVATMEHSLDALMGPYRFNGF